MGEDKDGVIISSRAWNSKVSKLVSILLLVALIGFIINLHPSMEETDTCKELAEDPTPDAGLAGYGCGMQEALSQAINLCCVIIPLICSFILLIISVPLNEEEE